MPCRLPGSEKCCQVYVGVEVVFFARGDEAAEAELL
jgi:hypothetical protein